MIIRYICMMIFLVLSVSEINSQEMKIITSREARDLIYDESGVFFKTIDFNQANVFKLVNDRFVIVSKDRSRFSILCSNIQSLIEIDFSSKLIQEMETDDVREKEQERVLNIENSIKDYILEIESKFSISLQSNNLSVLDSLDAKINQFGVKNLQERDVFIISLFLDDFFRRHTQDTFWALEKKFTLNTFSIPYILDKKKNRIFSFFRVMFKGYFENESNCLNLRDKFIYELAEYNDLELFSKEHIDFVKAMNTK